MRYRQENDNYNYCRENVLLFLPWRDESEEVETDNVIDTYNKNKRTIEQNRRKFNLISEEELEAALALHEKNSAGIEEEEHEELVADKLPDDLNVDIFGAETDGKGPSKKNEKTDPKKIRFTAPPCVEETDIHQMMQLLNNEQRQIVMHVLNCFKTSQNLPLRIFLSGSAGVGKSLVINTLFQLLTHFFDRQVPGEVNTDKLKVLLTAPSGKASFLIHGVTCHTAFALPITRNR